MGKNRKCYVPGCRGGYASQRKRNKELGLRNKSLFKPRSDAQRQKWCRAIPRLDRKFSERDVVCEDHFPEGAISRYTDIIMKDGSVVKWERGVPKLDPDAYPSIFPNCPKYVTRKVTVRKPPKKRDEHQLEKWRKAIPRYDRILRRTDVVCEVHFVEEDVIKHFETHMPDGTIFKLERKKPHITSSAIPCIFPNLPKNLSKVPKSRKPPKSRLPQAQLECTEVEMTREDPKLLRDGSHKGKKRSGQVEKPPGAATPERCDISDVEDCGMSEVVPEPFDFQVLMKEALNFSLPSDMWTVGVLKGNQVIFANWTDGETFEAKKRVLIDAELHVKIFFGNVTASLHNMKEVHSLAEVAAFLIVIDQLNICQSVRSPECLGHTIPREVSDKRTSAAICRNCCKAEKDSLQNGGKEVVGSIGSQSKILKKAPISSERSGHLRKKKKRKVLLEKGVIPDGKPSPKGAVKRVCGEAHAEGDGDTDSEEEVDIGEWAPPSEWRSLATPMRLLSPPPENVIRPTFTQPEALEKRGEEVTSSLDIETLVRDAHRIALPSDTWTLGVVKGKRLIFASWKVGKVLEAEKRLVVDEDLSVKVIFGNIILALDEIRNVIKFEDIGRYLYIVDKMSKCNGIGTGRRTASCPGYFIPGQVRGSCLSRCAYCRGASEELTRIRRKKRGPVQVRAEAQGKVWKNLKKLSDLYPEIKRSVKVPAS